MKTSVKILLTVVSLICSPAAYSSTVDVDSIVKTDSVAPCEFPEEQHELDLMRTRYVMNVMYRQYDKRLNEYAVSEFAKIEDVELRESRRELGDKLRAYPDAYTQIYNFLCEIQADPDRDDDAGAKVWGQRNLKKLHDLPAYKTSVGKAYSMFYLRDVIKRVESRLSECAHNGTIVTVKDISERMASGSNAKRRAIETDIDTSELLTVNVMSIPEQGENEIEKNEDKKCSLVSVADNEPSNESVVSDSTSDACDEKLQEILRKTDELRVKYAELMLAMPCDEEFVGLAVKYLDKVKDNRLSDNVEKLKESLAYYLVANAEVAKFIESLKSDAATKTKYSRAWYTKSLDDLRKLFAYKRIMQEEADLQIEFLKNIMIGIESRLTRACGDEVPPCYLGFDDFVNEMKPL